MGAVFTERLAGGSKSHRSLCPQRRSGLGDAGHTTRLQRGIEEVVSECGSLRINGARQRLGLGQFRNHAGADRFAGVLGVVTSRGRRRMMAP